MAVAAAWVAKKAMAADGRAVAGWAASGEAMPEEAWQVAERMAGVPVEDAAAAAKEGGMAVPAEGAEAQDSEAGMKASP